MENPVEGIAIVGISGKFPEADNLTQFYENLSSGKDSVKKPSVERLIYSGVNPSENYRIAGFLDRLEFFDHKFFNISKKEAEFMEPSQRIMLQLAVEAIENSGYALSHLAGTNTAVYIAASNIVPLIYRSKIESLYHEKDPTIHTGTLMSMVFGRISNALKLEGPAVMIDTGCSSGLIAINEACEKLKNKQVDYALAGAINVQLEFFEEGLTTGHLGAASSEGKTRAFDAGANGIGTGEGGGMVLLKRLADAIHDNDHIYAVIRGTGVTQDGGRSNSIAAPSPQAQTQAIQSAWSNAGIDPVTIDFIETHGAGTPLGDVIEFQALTDAFKEFTDKRKFCAISALKSNIGHLGNAAGIAGIMKAIVSIKNKKILPTIHFDTPNPYIDFENSAVFVNTELRDFDERSSPMRCGISCFGLSGTNAHMVLEEAPKIIEPVKYDESGTPCFLKVSAKTLTALKEYIIRITGHISETSDHLEDVLFTLNKGRDDYQYRVAVAADSKKQLLHSLEMMKSDDLITLKKIKREKRLVLLFSKNYPDNKNFDQLLIGYPGIQQHMRSLTQQYKVDSTDQSVKTILLQYCFYCCLNSMGVDILTVIGNGVGRLTAKVCTGGLTLEGALEMISNNEIPREQINESALENAVNTLKKNEVPVFMDIADQGNLFRKLNEWCKNEQLVDTQVLAWINNRESCGSPMQLVKKLYEEGVKISWNEFYAKKNRRRVEAPTYPFDKIRCWYTDPFEEKYSDVVNHFYESSWEPDHFENTPSKITNKTFLVFVDGHGLSEGVSKKLSEAGNSLIIIRSANKFQKRSITEYDIDGTNFSDYLQLRKALGKDSINVNGILNFSNFIDPQAVRNRSTQFLFDQYFMTQYFLLKAFHAEFKESGFCFLAVTSNGQLVPGIETDIMEYNAMIMVLVKSLLVEYPTIQATFVDVDFSDKDSYSLSGDVVDAMQNTGLIRFFTYRKGVRYIPGLSSVKHNENGTHTTLNPGGAYVVTGGTSGIGLEFCKHIASKGKCDLIILGRTKLPQKSEWTRSKDFPETFSKSYLSKIDALSGLEELGANVTYYQVNVDDDSRIKAIFEEIKLKHKRLDGIVHSAGLTNRGISIENSDLIEFRKVFGPKVFGTVSLYEHSKELNPGFLLMFSSIGAIVPSKYSLDYSCANSFLDAFALAKRTNDTRFVAINWSDWKETGLVYRKNKTRTEEEIESRENILTGLTNKEGTYAIEKILTYNKPQVAVAKVNLSNFNINPFFNLDRQNGNPEMHQPVLPEAKRDVIDTSEGVTIELELVDDDVSELEMEVINIWHKVLKLDSISVDDDFYEIGGHSLNMTHMLNMVKSEIGMELGIEELLENNTVRKLARRIEELKVDKKPTLTSEIVPIAKRPHYQLSHTQRRFWLLHQFEGKEAYNVPNVFSLNGIVEKEHLQKAFEMLIERHEALRTGIGLHEGQPVQRILEMNEIDFNMGYMDLEFDNEADETLQKIIDDVISKPFDLSIAPLLRVCLVRLAENQYVFAMAIHHIIADGRSMFILRSELLNIYKALTNDQSVNLPPLGIQYKDFAFWQNSAIAEGRFDEHKRYWMSKLINTSARMSLPIDDNPGSDNTAGQMEVVIMGEEFEGLKKIATDNGTTLFVVMLSIFNVFLQKITNDSPVLIGSPVDGRQYPELDTQIGSFLNTVIFKTDIIQNESFSDLLSRKKKEVMLDLNHQEYPYDLLIRELSDRMNNKTEHFNVGFTWNRKENIAQSLELDFEIENHPFDLSYSKSDIWLMVSETDQGILCDFIYDKGRFKADTVQLLSERFKCIVPQIIDSPASKISDYEIKLELELELEENKFHEKF